MDTHKPAQVARREPLDLLRWDYGFPLMRRLMRDVDTLFNRIGPEQFPLMQKEGFWTPDVEVLQKGQEFVVRADIPGMKKEELKIEVTDNALILQGERTREKEEKGEGFFKSERSYGSFCRTVPLPEGVKPEEAKASVADGVLEVRMPMAKAEEKRRRLEISEPKAEKSGTKAA